MTLTLFDMRLQDIHSKLASKELSVSDLVDHSLKRIEEVDGKVNAFLTLDEERARTRARELDDALGTDKQRGMLFGLPIGLKDNIVTEGLKTTCASKMLANYDPIYDATVVKKLKEADTITIGKLNMDEFAMGSSTETSAMRTTRNPWNLDYVPGGSSGGSAAAVASGQVYFALGTDTGGSIRQPAAYCGVVGMRPTYGLVSRYGSVAFSSSLDQVGPITKNVEDAAYVLQAIAGHDPFDSTSAKTDIPDYIQALTGEVKGLKVGVPREYLGEGIDPQVKAAVTNALKQLESLGAEVEEMSLPHAEHAMAVYYVIASAEASSNLSRFDGIRYGVRSPNAESMIDIYYKSRSEGFGPEVKRRILLGTYVLSSGQYEKYYVKAQKVRALIKRDFTEAMEKYDLIAGPTVPAPAFKLGAKIDDPLTMYMNDLCTVPSSLAGHPAISVPCGFVDGLPIGLHLVGRPFAESTLFRAAHAYEQSTEFHRMRPTLS